MKPDVRDVYTRPKGYAERLDGAVEVLVVNRVLIVPDAGTWICHFGTHKPNTIVSRIGFSLNHGRAGPGPDCWLLSHGRASGAKGEVCRSATHVIPLVGGIVVHVALAWMTLAPGVFVRDDVFCLSKIGGARVLRRDQVIRFHQNSMRRYVVNVTAVIVRLRTWENTGEWIDPGARTDAPLAAV